MQFKVGDLVVHKTGGPTMCVANVGNEYISCVYWEKLDYSFHQYDFISDELAPV